MKLGKWIAVLGAAVGVAAAVVYFTRQQKEETPPENSFLQTWANAMAEDPRVFAGLYSGLVRICDGTAREPEKTMGEWCQRAHTRWEGKPADLLCREQILPAVEAQDREAVAQYADLLLQAAADAGIAADPLGLLVLAEDNWQDYAEQDGRELNPLDTVEVLVPAWYQYDVLLEQGQCRLLSQETN